MAPRILSRQAIRIAKYSSNLQTQQLQLPSCLIVRHSSTNDYSKMPKKDTPGPGPNSEPLGHVTEEAAAMGKITGDPNAPDMSQGTPVQEVLKRDPEAKEKAPKVLKDAIAKEKPSGTRSYSTMVQRSLPSEPEDRFFKEVDAETEYINMPGAEFAQLIPPPGSEPESYLTKHDVFMGKEEPRHKFGMPDTKKIQKMQKRYPDILEQLTGLMMERGKKSKAETNVARILNNLKTSRPPVLTTSRPLLPGIPPAQHLPLNPILYLTLAIDAVAPMIRIKAIKGAAGGGRAMPLPMPLPIRTRRRLAINWILEAAANKPSRGSGHEGYAQRITEEIVSILEGKSGLWQKRTELHKQGVVARANMGKKFRTKKTKSLFAS